MSGHDVTSSSQPGHAGNGEHQIPADQTTVQQQAIASKLISASFGEIVSILMHSKAYRSWTLAEVEALVVPALLTSQFMVGEGRKKDSGFSAPLGVVFWAHVSTEVDARLSTNLVEPLKLRPNEWRSGDIAWIVDAIGPSQVLQPLIQRVRGAVLKGKAIKLRTEENGVPHLRTLPAMT